jgi:hypothetical protein
VRVKSEDAAVRWRKPHLRTPGYIFGVVGIVEQECLGVAANPEQLAFRQPAEAQVGCFLTYLPLSLCLGNLWGFLFRGEAFGVVGRVERECLGLAANPKRLAFRQLAEALGGGGGPGGRRYGLPLSWGTHP